jgi:hypothetical protein
MIRIYYDELSGEITGSSSDSFPWASNDAYVLSPDMIRISDYRVDLATKQLVELEDKPPIATRRPSSSL